MSLDQMSLDVLDITVVVILLGTGVFSAYFWYKDWNERQVLKRRPNDHNDRTNNSGSK